MPDPRVAGATGDIGSAIVAAYRTLGYRVVATARAMLEPHEPDLVAVDGDQADRDAGVAVSEAAMQAFSGVDTLVNSARSRATAARSRLVAGAVDVFAYQRSSMITARP